MSDSIADRRATTRQNTGSRMDSHALLRVITLILMAICSTVCAVLTASNALGQAVLSLSVLVALLIAYRACR
jgi:high-affinity K+ transport system ATPase subunit B